MQIITDEAGFEIKERTAVAIGKFDGIHRGHQELLRNILLKKQQGLRSTVFTFEPSPAEFFLGTKQQELLTKKEKRERFAEMGIDYLVEFPLNPETAAISPETFLEQILWKQMRTSYISAGTDLSFGDKGKGDVELLLRYADRLGYQAEIVEKVRLGGREISSTYVREAVKQGDMELAAKLLGRPYSVKGSVVHGNELGRRLGTPTANLVPEPEKLLPPRGVYVSKVSVDGGCYAGITNIGCKPTVGEREVFGVETYLLDAQLDLYGKPIEVFLYQFSRPERKFPDIAALVEQLKADKQESYNYFHILPIRGVEQ